VAPLGAQRADLAVKALGARGHARMANLAHYFAPDFRSSRGAVLSGDLTNPPFSLRQ